MLLQYNTNFTYINLVSMLKYITITRFLIFNFYYINTTYTYKQLKLSYINSIAIFYITLINIYINYYLKNALQKIIKMEHVDYLQYSLTSIKPHAIIKCIVNIVIYIYQNTAKFKRR